VIPSLSAQDLVESLKKFNRANKGFLLRFIFFDQKGKELIQLALLKIEQEGARIQY
jgi:hypothetical protein